MENTTPVSYILSGYECNNNCVSCVYYGTAQKLRRERGDFGLSTRAIQKIIRESKEEGMHNLILSGGEPTIRKDFFGILKYARCAGLNISVQTNGRAFANPQFSKSIISTHRDIPLNISLYHSNPVVHDKITKVKGSWKQTVKGLENLKQLGATQVSLTTVLLTLNCSAVMPIAKLAHGLGVRGITFKHPTPTPKILEQKLLPKFSRLQKHIQSSIAFGNRNRISISFSGIPLCFMKGYVKRSLELIEDYHGLNKRLNLPMEKKQDFKKLFFSLKCKPMKCKTCAYYYICEGVWTDYLSFYGDAELEPVPGKQVKTREQLKSLLGKSL